MSNSVKVIQTLFAKKSLLSVHDLWVSLCTQLYSSSVGSQVEQNNRTEPDDEKSKIGGESFDSALSSSYNGKDPTGRTVADDTVTAMIDNNDNHNGDVKYRQMFLLCLNMIVDKRCAFNCINNLLVLCHFVVTGMGVLRFAWIEYVHSNDCPRRIPPVQSAK
ncbi:hypothetical protein GQX74_009230 [Glossina fuscipes]|nr:hypothetical protein GQX74_009230 [Glossina fuscipes]